jgi:hypothetical protein
MLSAKNESVLRVALGSKDAATEVLRHLTGGGTTDQSVGAKAGTGVTVAEYGGKVIHQTVLTLASVSITMTDATTAGNQGSQKVYDFPEGNILVLGTTANLTTLAGAGGIGDTAALVGSIGSVAASAADATLTSTEANLVASMTGTLVGGAGTLTGVNSAVTFLDGTATAADAILNLAVPDAGSSANDTVAVSGTITITWINLGDK